ncbi:MAG: hypothetical protein ABWX96_13615 [Propionibacteriaceae bacterium]
MKSVPHWFTLLLHYWFRRECRRVGHIGADGKPPQYICVHCGQLMNGFTNEQADLNQAQMRAWMDKNGF